MIPRPSSQGREQEPLYRGGHRTISQGRAYDHLSEAVTQRPFSGANIGTFYRGGQSGLFIEADAGPFFRGGHRTISQRRTQDYLSQAVTGLSLSVLSGGHRTLSQGRTKDYLSEADTGPFLVDGPRTISQRRTQDPIPGADHGLSLRGGHRTLSRRRT